MMGPSTRRSLRPGGPATPGHPANPGRCEEVRAALEDVLALEALSDRHVAHAEQCDACGALLEQHRAMALLVARARRAHDREPDLAPHAWVRVRAGVDSARSRRRFVVLGVFGASLAAAAALVLVVGRQEPVAPLRAQGLAVATVPAALAAAPTFTPRLETLEDGRAIVVAAGDRLEAGPNGRTLAAFGRHAIILAPGTTLAVQRWSPDGMDLAVVAGSATFEVERASPAETFVVRSGDVAVHVRGTIFTVERGAAGETRVTVDRGRVAVARGDGDEVPVSAGERVTFPAEVAALEPAPGPADDQGAPAPAPRPRRATPAPEKVVAIDVGMQRAPGADDGSAALLDVGRLVPTVLATVRAGRCAQALNALAEIGRALAASHQEGPRPLVWLTAWCKRKLGDVAGSATLFKRYGEGGPWAVPEGDELPPLP